MSEREAPCDLGAERALLGAMLLSPVAVERAVTITSAAQFYDPRHETIYRAIVDVHRATANADPITVSAHLQASGDLGRVGGGSYLADLYATPPTTSNADYYANIVADRAKRRRVITITAQAAQRAWATDGDDADALVEAAIRELEIIRDFEATDDTGLLTVDQFLDVAEKDTYDWIVPNLLERGDRLLITGQEGAGKALAVDTPVPTPKGWSTMGALAVGDEVFAPDGTPTRVVAATSVVHDRPCYRVRFSDGASIVADEAHLWLTETLKAREAHVRYANKPDYVKPRGTNQQHKRIHFPAVVTTRDIHETLMARQGHTYNHSIPTCEPLQYADQELPIPPYILGAWLGDGSSRLAAITSADEEITDHIRSLGQPCRKSGKAYLWAMSAGPKGPNPTSLNARLRRLGLLKNKHIPDVYQQSGVGQRLELLRGLMDTDGTVGASGASHGRGTGAAQCEFSVVSERLARDVHELLLGLGIKVVWRESDAVLGGRVIGTRYRLGFQTDLKIFRLSRKAERLTPLRTRRANLRYIVAVIKVPSVPVRCIQVDREDGMFVVGRECIPTHNSHLLRQLATCTASGVHVFTGRPIEARRVLILDMENSDTQTRRNLRPIVTTARRLGHTLDPDRFWIQCRPEGLDLNRDTDLAWLMRRVAEAQPDLLITGSLYKMSGGKAINSDDDAAPVLAAFNAIRGKGVTTVIEAHAGHALGSGGKRDLRPRGSAALLGWPEFGYGMRHAEDATPQHRVVELIPWRGDRDERTWPERIEAGSVWPWQEAAPQGFRPGAWAAS